MNESTALAQLSERMGALAPPISGKAARAELDRIGLGASLSPVSRAEFEALRLLLRYTRAHLDLLAPRLARLEVRYGLSPASSIGALDYPQVNATLSLAGLDSGQLPHCKASP